MVSSPTPLKNQPYGLDNAIVTNNGILHWVNSGGKQIVAYDPLNNVGICHTIHIPNVNPNDVVIGASCIGVCNGNLRVSQVIGYDINHGVHQVWELVDYSLGKWKLVNKVRIKDMPLPKNLKRIYGRRVMKIVAFHTLNEDIIFIILMEERLISYHMRTRILQVVINLEKHEYRPSDDFEKFYPLLHPWWPTPVPPARESERICLL